jgi:hypothetical protein
MQPQEKIRECHREQSLNSILKLIYAIFGETLFHFLALMVSNMDNKMQLYNRLLYKNYPHLMSYLR